MEGMNQTWVQHMEMSQYIPLYKGHMVIKRF
jgi:hypothetical protein